VAAERRVLLVEDEDVLRTLLCRLLERAGCAVTCAGDGDEALRLFDAGSPFDVAVLDVGVPPAGAAAALRALRARRADLAAVLISGSGPDEEVRALLRDGRSAFLAKPFAPEELTRALAALGTLGALGAGRCR
jgi:CheY-like chemotaxis protein